MTTENCIRITKVAKSLKIKVLEDICLNFIMKSIEPLQTELTDNGPKQRRHLDLAEHALNASGSL